MSKKNIALMATGFIAAGLMIVGCNEKPQAAPSGPLGSASNPIDLTNVKGWDFEAAKTIARSYRESDNVNTITIEPDGLVKMYNAYAGQFVKVPTGDGITREFAIEGKCVDGVPALELKENGEPVGSMIAEGSDVKPTQIYAARPIAELYPAYDDGWHAAPAMCK